MIDNKNKKNPFGVPENYFQDFNAEIISKLPEKKVAENKKTIPLWKTVSKWAAAIAIVTSMTFAGIHYMDNNIRNTSPGIASEGSIIASENSAALENDYYQFLEEEATRIAYRNTYYNDDF